MEQTTRQMAAKVWTRRMSRILLQSLITRCYNDDKALRTSISPPCIDGKVQANWTTKLMCNWTIPISTISRLLASEALTTTQNLFAAISLCKEQSFQGVLKLDGASSAAPTFSPSGTWERQ